MARISEGLMYTHSCGELTAKNIGDQVSVCGWVSKYRDLGGLHFVDLRDKYGMTQLAFDKFLSENGKEEDLKKLSLESVVKASGVVRSRPDEAKNKKMVTGEVEVEVHQLELLSSSDKDNIPFLPYGAIEATEDLRLKYR